MKELKEEIYKELNLEFKEKFKYSEDIFNQFFDEYILNYINDSDLLKEINRVNRDISGLKIPDYLENERILLRTIKVLAMLEISKDFNAFKRDVKRLKSDKEYNVIDFEKILKNLSKVPKE